jgi:Protein of unknown function (DUF2867)
MRYRISRMKLPKDAHTSQGWRIDELIPDFRLEDVWALPTPGGPDDFPLLVEGLASADPAKSLPRAARALWEIRFKLGGQLGWDEPDTGLDSRVSSLQGRLPADLRDAPPGPAFDALPFTSLYQLENEWAAEMANRTVHGVMHIGWVAAETGGYHGQMAVYVKPNGPLGSAYMAAIKPFRYLIVYPQMMRAIERQWRSDDRTE